MQIEKKASTYSSSKFGGKVNAIVLVPKGTTFNIPFGGEHPHCKKFRNKDNKYKYGGGTKFVYLLPVSEFIKHGVPKEGVLVKKSNGKCIPYKNYNPEKDWITRHKDFNKYQDLAVWNNYLPNRNDVIDMIDKLKDFKNFHNLSVACVGYDAWANNEPDVQLGVTGGVEQSDHEKNHDPKKYAAAREVWEELGLSGKGTTSSNNNTVPIENCVYSIGNTFLFVMT